MSQGENMRKASVLSGSPTVFNTSFGGGNFGSWINDEFGLPAYEYSPSVATPPVDAFHQLGNDSMTALAHADGYVELFTSRTFPRFANKYIASDFNFAGGFGWVVDGNSLWSTFYADRPPASNYQRIFGMGYCKKVASNGGLQLTQYVFAPDGDDDVLIEKIVFENISAMPKQIQYFDYWDVAWWFPRLGILSGYEWSTVTTVFDPTRAAIKAVSTSLAGNIALPNALGDPSPKTSFVTFLSDSIDAFDTVKKAFFGQGTRQAPAAVTAGSLSNSLDGSGLLLNQDAVLATQKNFSLAPGASRTMFVLYGIAARGSEDAVIDAYRANYAMRLADTTAAWSARLPQFVVPQDTWLQREMAWSYYYLRSGILKDDFFGLHIANQGGYYLYGLGLNAAMRDPLQHVLPLIYSDPGLAKETLVYVLRAMKQNGQIPYGIAGHGSWSNFPFDPSDMSLWLFWTVSEYVCATRDFAFLDEFHPFYDAGGATTYDALKSAFAYQTQVIGTGSHGLIRLRNSDWDDTLVLSSGNPIGTATNGESTMNTVMAIAIYPRLAQLAVRKGDAAFATSINTATAALTTAANNQWKGNQFNRAWIEDQLFSGTLTEVGANQFFLESNVFGLLADILSPADVDTLVGTIKTHASDPSSIGASVQAAGATRFATGTWYSMSAACLLGLLRQASSNAHARSLAWTEFRKNTLGNHADLYPDLWYGIWSGPDFYANELQNSQQPGTYSLSNFPIANMHAHSQPLWISLNIAGLRVDSAGYTIDPAVPFTDFSWASQIYQVQFTSRTAAGSIQALANDTIRMNVRLPASINPATMSVHVHGGVVPFSIASGMAVFDLPLTAGASTVWTIA
jgi:hypothetical protein